MLPRCLSGCPGLCLDILPEMEWKTEILSELETWATLLDTDPWRKAQSVPEKNKETENNKSKHDVSYGGEHGGWTAKGTGAVML